MVEYLAGRLAVSSAGSPTTATRRPGQRRKCLEMVAAHPGGRIVLWLLGGGFVGYALLALVQATFRHQEIQRSSERRPSGCSSPASPSSILPSPSMPPPWSSGPK